MAFKVGSAVSYDCSRLLAREILENVAQMSPFHSPSLLEFYCLLKNWEHWERPVETLYEQDFYSLREDCHKTKTLFKDPEFLPRDEFLREPSKVEWFS